MGGEDFRQKLEEFHQKFNKLIDKDGYKVAREFNHELYEIEYNNYLKHIKENNQPAIEGSLNCLGALVTQGLNLVKMESGVYRK